MRHESRIAALRARGFTTSNAEAKAALLAQCDTALDAMSAPATGRWTMWAPGRIEVFGKHTDYAGGRSLLTAVERGFVARAVPRNDARIRVVDPSTGNACETVIELAASAPEGHWSNYVATVARRVARNFPAAHTGIDLAFVSDLPVAAGVSSSSALMIAVFSALSAVNRLAESPAWQESLSTMPALGGYMGAMENGLTFGALAGDTGVGTLGGSQDQTAILCAEPGHVIDFGWMPVQRLGSYALPDSVRFVVASSGVVAEKSAGAREQYNRASRLVRHLLASWNAAMQRDDRSLAAAVQSRATAIEELRALIPAHTTEQFTAQALRERFDQFVQETYTLIPAAASAFAAHDWRTLGDVTARSQQAAETWLGNQVPETIALVSLAREHGAIAASAFGAGFGGSVWALVDTARAAAFERAWADAYRDRFPEPASRAMFFITESGPPAAHWADAPTAS